MSDLSSQPTSIQSLYSWFKDDKLYVNRRYQRKLVWTLEEKQKLVESILKKYPIPAILLAEKDKTGTFEIIDGLQRLNAILSFIELKFPTLDGKFFQLDYFTTAKAKLDSEGVQPEEGLDFIDQQTVSNILDYTLAFSIMRNAHEHEIHDVFDRINTYGHRLSDQERRQAGVENEFSNVVRQIACEIRGDNSAEYLLLGKMPSISIDLPMTKHGYDVKADEVFWVQQGVLRSTDLRDSIDEQCIADIVASIVQNQLIKRTKEALDKIYDSKESQYESINSSLRVYGSDKISEEFKFCISEIEKICNIDSPEKLRNLIFSKSTSNAFPSIFAILFIAIHESLIQENMIVSSYTEMKKALKGLDKRIDSSKKSGSVEERRKNINTIKGIIKDSLVASKNQQHIYGKHLNIDINNSIRRSEVELANYELKQGLLTLDHDPKISLKLLDKINKTICAIANIGPLSDGKIIIGVADSDCDKAKIEERYSITSRPIGKRFIVGISREVKFLGITAEEYLKILIDSIKNSKLSSELKSSVLSNLDYNDFYGLGLIIIAIPPQNNLSYLDDEIYIREADNTILCNTAKQIVSVTKRFN